MSLGVIQALASHPRSEPRGNDKPGAPCARADQCLLTRFHYLSTASGGGYIGSWLSLGARVHRGRISGAT